MALGHLCADYSSGSNTRDADAWRALVKEVSRRANESTYQTGVSVDEEELLGNVARNDAVGLYMYPYYKGMDACGASRVMIKEHQGWRLAPFMLEAFPGTKIIAQVRDPRGHAASCKKLGKFYVAYHGSIQRAAQMWAQDASGAVKLKEARGENVVRIHRYEDLASQPRETLQAICKFLDLPWDEAMLEFYKAQQAAKERLSDKYRQNMWANLDRPVSTRSVKQWEKELSPCEVRIVEGEAGPLLDKFGYESSGRGSVISRTFCRVYKLGAAVRHALVTRAIWLAWLISKKDRRVAPDVIRGDAIQALLPYERFRDRLAYRL
jgi:sulfotransferase family protein